jgi:hypothetical protein
MRSDVTRIQTPEEQELDRKLSELNELETELAQCELDLLTLQTELRTFESKYLRIIGVKYAELDDILAQIAEAEALAKPQDKKIQEQASQARAQAKESAQAAWITEEPRMEKFRPSESLKKLYREVAKRIHPDLAEDEEERIKLQKLMADANRAYEEGDEQKLRDILNAWESSPESVRGEGVAAELVRVIRKIAQISKRLRAIKTEIVHMKESDLYRLKIKADRAEDEGRDLLNEMALKVGEEIVSASKRLVEITKERVHK